ncbi:MAG: peptidoglycan editing factor PgeF [Bryobacteraceae bacterium]
MRLDWLDHGFGTRHAHEFGSGPEIASLKQIHSNICQNADSAAGCLGEGDALVSRRPGRRLSVRTADCVPILLADERTRAVAAVHAGWRGTVSRVAPAAVQALCKRYGSQPDDLHAAIGPGIGMCCFEVGPEVAAQFGKSGRARVDLIDENRRQLRGLGVPPERIYTANLCTCCLKDRFHSFRRDRERAGRMVSLVGIRGEVLQEGV